MDGKMMGNADILLSAGCEVRCIVAAPPQDGALHAAVVRARDSTQALVVETHIQLGTGMSPAFTEHDEFIVGYLAPGRYVFEAASTEAAWHTVELEVAEHDRNLVEFRLPAGKALVVAVTDPAGKSVLGAIPEIRDALGRNRSWRTEDYEQDWVLSRDSASDGKGITRIKRLLPGSYTLTVRAVGYRTAEQQVTVLDTDETHVTVVLDRLPYE